MLHFLVPKRFENEGMRVLHEKNRPKQGKDIDCGVYVMKYMDDMLNGISLREAVGDQNLDIVDIVNFRYHIAWELYKGTIRRTSDYGIQQRNKGLQLTFFMYIRIIFVICGLIRLTVGVVDFIRF